jgi:hypothetical protein
MAKPKHMLVFVSMASALGGCGLLLPDLQPFGESKDRERADENVIVNQIKCELRKGVQQTLNDPFFKTPEPLAGNSVDWLDTWAATVALDLTVEEQSALGPGNLADRTVSRPFESQPRSQHRGPGLDRRHAQGDNVLYLFVRGAQRGAGPARSVRGRKRGS